MGTVKWNAFLPGLCSFAVALGVMAASARADVTTERGSSILMFPKVIVAGTFDTTIQITNISNDLVYARCFYINAQLTDPTRPEDPLLNPPLWLETDFNIRLTRQQPTHWDVLTGRGVNPFDSCNSMSPPPYTCVTGPNGDVDLGGTGIDPGAVPPVVDNFVGELKCVEVDGSGNPIGGNHLKGEATLRTDDGDVSKYNAIGIEGTDLAGATGNELQLNNPEGQSSGQYNACPAVLLLNHFAEGAEEPVAAQHGQGRRCSVTTTTLCTLDEDCLTGETCDQASTIFTELTLIPCSQDIENQIPSKVTVQFKIYNEFESAFSTSTTVACWKNILLTDIGNSNVFDVSVLGTDVAHTRITPADDQNGAVVGVAEEIHTDASARVARAAFNIHTEGDRFFGPGGDQFDRMVLPGE
jgi:hypothetical protein